MSLPDIIAYVIFSGVSGFAIFVSIAGTRSMLRMRTVTAKTQKAYDEVMQQKARLEAEAQQAWEQILALDSLLQTIAVLSARDYLMKQPVWETWCGTMGDMEINIRALRYNWQTTAHIIKDDQTL